jgi:hypothetical protein
MVAALGAWCLLGQPPAITFAGSFSRLTQINPFELGHP